MFGRKTKEEREKPDSSRNAEFYKTLDTVKGGVGTVGDKFHGYDHDDKSVNY